MLGGLYLGQTYLGDVYSPPLAVTLYRGDAPAIKQVLVTYRYTSSIYDEDAPYDSLDTYDGSEEVMPADSAFASAEQLLTKAPVIMALRASHNYSSSVYDEDAPYDADESYDGDEIVQTQSGNDILIHIPSVRV